MNSTNSPNQATKKSTPSTSSAKRGTSKSNNFNNASSPLVGRNQANQQVPSGSSAKSNSNNNTTALLTLQMNLKSLKRQDPFAVDILKTASHVVLYRFDPSKAEWERREVEGTLFVYSRQVSPTFAFIIMNRLNVENFTSYINPSMELQITDAYIIFKKSDTEEIYGIWFFRDNEREMIGEAFKEYSKLGFFQEEEYNDSSLDRNFNANFNANANFVNFNANSNAHANANFNAHSNANFNANSNTNANDVLLVPSSLPFDDNDEQLLLHNLKQLQELNNNIINRPNPNMQQTSFNQQLYNPATFNGNGNHQVLHNNNNNQNVLSSSPSPFAGNALKSAYLQNGKLIDSPSPSSSPSNNNLHNPMGAFMSHQSNYGTPNANANNANGFNFHNSVNGNNKLQFMQQNQNTMMMLPPNESINPSGNHLELLFKRAAERAALGNGNGNGNNNFNNNFHQNANSSPLIEILNHQSQSGSPSQNLQNLQQSILLSSTPLLLSSSSAQNPSSFPFQLPTHNVNNYNNNSFQGQLLAANNNASSANYLNQQNQLFNNAGGNGFVSNASAPMPSSSNSILLAPNSPLVSSNNNIISSPSPIGKVNSNSLLANSNLVSPSPSLLSKRVSNVKDDSAGNNSPTSSSYAGILRKSNGKKSSSKGPGGGHRRKFSTQDALAIPLPNDVKRSQDQEGLVLFDGVEDKGNDEESALFDDDKGRTGELNDKGLEDKKSKPKSSKNNGSKQQKKKNQPDEDNLLIVDKVQFLNDVQAVDSTSASEKRGRRRRHSSSSASRTPKVTSALVVPPVKSSIETQNGNGNPKNNYSSTPKKSPLKGNNPNGISSKSLANNNNNINNRGNVNASSNNNSSRSSVEGDEEDEVDDEDTNGLKSNKNQNDEENNEADQVLKETLLLKGSLLGTVVQLVSKKNGDSPNSFPLTKHQFRNRLVKLLKNDHDLLESLYHTYLSNREKSDETLCGSIFKVTGAPVTW